MGYSYFTFSKHCWTIPLTSQKAHLTQVRSRWSAGFPNKVTIPFLKTSSLCPLKSKVRLDSEHIHETLAEVLLILDEIHNVTLTIDICGLKEDTQMASRHMNLLSIPN